MRVVVPFLLLAGCPGGKPGEGSPADTADTGAPCVDTPRPLLTVDATLVDFTAVGGPIDAGYTLLGTVTLRNDGDAPLGVRLGLGEGLPDFAAPSAGTASCATEETVDGSPVHVLAPGCELGVNLAYSPVDPWGAADALVVESVGDGAGAYAADPLHAYRVVWLHGRSTGEWAGGASYVAGGVIALGQTALWEGESTTTELLVFGPDAAGVVVEWSSERSETPFSPDTGASVTYTAPGVDAPGRRDTIYAVVGSDAGTDWAFGGINVYDRSEAIYACP